MKRITKIIRQNGQSIELQKNNVDHRSNVRSKGLVNEVQDYKSKDLRSKKIRSEITKHFGPNIGWTHLKMEVKK